MNGSGGIYRRRLEEVIQARLDEEPVVVVQGARTSGKSTLLRELADAREAAVVDLDEPATRDAATASPSAFARGDGPVFVDEYQHVPQILDAIKAELNRDLRPGRYVLTGSTRYSSLPAAAQSLAGRVHVMTLWPLSQGEIDGEREGFVERLVFEPEILLDSAPASTTTRVEYVSRILRGGLPLAVARQAGVGRDRWFDDYLRVVIERDVVDLSRIRQREKMPVLLAQLGGQTAQLLNVARAADAVGLESSTAEKYVRLLEAAFIVHRLPAWGTTLRARAGARPKIHFVDSGVAGRMLRVSAARLAALEPQAMTVLGHLLETFCVGEVVKQVGWLPHPVHVGHWRTRDGDEVDLVLERDDGAVVAIEVKAGERVRSSDLGGMRKLRSALGDRFLRGVVLHLGPRAYPVEDRVHAVPVDRLWSPR
ncbi:MAG: ATP-binding protein [Solirubrobacterales bacterium]|nr:ATP-binding protein [Solirubrobacterales bacterium]